jgi:hypothetical protein
MELKPRYKVIALYPDCPFKLGEILELGKDEYDAWAYVYDYDGTALWHQSYFECYPHLFHQVEWWEGLEPEEMPQYVKLKEKSFLTAEILEAGTIVKVLKHFTSSNGEVNLRGCQIFGNDFLAYFKTEPATKEQYEEYIKQKQ